MKSVPTAVILLVIAIMLLYLAITDKLSRILDAWDVLLGKSTASAAGGSGATGGVHFSIGNGATISIPSLPNLPSIPTGGINIPQGF